jgi:hypothetical protein
MRDALLLFLGNLLLYRRVPRCSFAARAGDRFRAAGRSGEETATAGEILVR